MSENYFRKCGHCKKEISFGAIYQKCTVSSCRKHVYCSVDCWSIHDSVMGHISAAAEESIAPLKGKEEKPRRRIVGPQNSGSTKGNSEYDLDVLIVASKLKKYVKDRHDLNTSANVMERLSDLVRRLVDDAVDSARKEGRKTLMDRDF